MLAPQLWGVAPTDAATFLAVSIGVLVAAAAGCAPAIKRALAIDPAATLRCE